MTVDEMRLRDLARLYVSTRKEAAARYRRHRGNPELADEDAMSAVMTALTEAGMLLPELPDNWWSIELTVRKEGPADRDIEALIWLTDDAETILEGHGPTNPAALADALCAKGDADE